MKHKGFYARNGVPKEVKAKPETQAAGTKGFKFSWFLIEEPARGRVASAILCHSRMPLAGIHCFTER